MSDIARKPMGTLSRQQIEAEITRRAQNLLRDGLTPEQAVTAAGSSFRAERKRHTDKQFNDVMAWLKGERRSTIKS